MTIFHGQQRSFKVSDDLLFIEFSLEDFPEYLSWFQDPELNRRLVPMKENDEWLSHVLNDKDGCTYSVIQNRKLISVIGIIFPDTKHKYYCISNIAIHPAHQRKGLGKIILEKLMLLHESKKAQHWRAYIDASNSIAFSFFEKNGWEASDETADNMYCFQFISK